MAKKLLTPKEIANNTISYLRVPKKYRYRSAVTGRYVTKTYAWNFPENTVKERVQ